MGIFQIGFICIAYPKLTAQCIWILIEIWLHIEKIPAANHFFNNTLIRQNHCPFVIFLIISSIYHVFFPLSINVVQGLHQKAGSKAVYELHGSVLRNVCMDCGAKYDLDYIMDEDNCHKGMPHCEKCGGLVKPDVVLYEEPLDDSVIMGAVKAISEADTMIVGGTSLVVYPAAGLINYFRGDDLILINKSETGYDSQATLVINDSIGKVLGD